ncbi:hypothetical protein [uncultured Lacinutrix sp.]|uniref:hypothetical protein n=1 Tax=uncultured Lacinutrix sp. TaxID=574032 RepID=UPI00263947AA|nr:hypothetical protein [uncultured Lacinutrix sp.]
MKKLLQITVLLLFCFNAFSQDLKQYQELSVDSMLINVDMKALDSGILYDRTSALSNLKEFNTKEKNIATVKLFEQALYDLYKSSNKEKFVSYKTARKNYPVNTEYDQVGIGIINARFQSVNFNEENKEENGLRLEKGNFHEIEGKKTFNEHNTLIFAPLRDYAMGDVINFSFDKSLFFEESNNKICFY